MNGNHQDTLSHLCATYEKPTLALTHPVISGTYVSLTRPKKKHAPNLPLYDAHYVPCMRPLCALTRILHTPYVPLYAPLRAPYAAILTRSLCASYTPIMLSCNDRPLPEF